MGPNLFISRAFNLASKLTEGWLAEFMNSITRTKRKKVRICMQKGEQKKVFILISSRVKIAEIKKG